MISFKKSSNIDPRDNQKSTTIELCGNADCTNLNDDTMTVTIHHKITFSAYNFLLISKGRIPQFFIEALSTDLHYYACKLVIGESGFRLEDGTGVLAINATANNLTMLEESVLKALSRINTNAMLETTKQWC